MSGKVELILTLVPCTRSDYFTCVLNAKNLPCFGKLHAGMIIACQIFDHGSACYFRAPYTSGVSAVFKGEVRNSGERLLVFELNSQTNISINNSPFCAPSEAPPSNAHCQGSNTNDDTPISSLSLPCVPWLN